MFSQAELKAGRQEKAYVCPKIRCQTEFAQLNYIKEDMIVFYALGNIKQRLEFALTLRSETFWKVYDSITERGIGD